MSLVNRAAIANVMPSSHPILEQVGAVHAQNPTAAIAADIDEKKLAAILRVPCEEIALRRHPTVRKNGINGLVDFFGATVRADEIGFRRRRFAPAAIGSSAHVRALWGLMNVPCCTETWQYLRDACTCGAVQGWRHAWNLSRCDRCNARLDRIGADVVAPDLRPGLAFVIGLLDPDPMRRVEARRALPPVLTEWDGGTVFELALALMPLTAASYRLHRGETVPMKERVRHATALAQSAEIVPNWPNSFVPALEGAVMRRSRSRVNVRYSGIADYLPALKSEVLPSELREELEKALTPIRSEAGTTPGEQISMMDAADLLGRDLRILAPARRAGHLKTMVCLRANRVFPTLDRAEVEHIRDFGTNRHSSERVADGLDLPRYAMTLMADEGLIAFESNPFVLARYSDPQLHRMEAERFRNGLRDAAVSPEHIIDPIPLNRVARGIGGGFKPWGRIIQSLINGSMPFSMSDARAGKIMIGAQSAVMFQSLEIGAAVHPTNASTCSQRDALEILNLPGKHSALLTGLLDVRADWEMDWDDVLRVAATRITLTELAARTGINPTRLEGRLNAVGVRRSDGFGRKRDQALAALKAMIPETGAWPDPIHDRDI